MNAYETLLAIDAVPFGNSSVPKPRCEERKRACACEVNQKWRGQHEPCRHGGRGGQSAGQVTVKRAGSGALGTFVEQQVKSFRVGGKLGRAIRRARDAASRRRWNAVST